MHYFNLNKRLEADTHYISDLALCRLLIMNNADYPWVILVPRIFNITEIHQLTEMDRKKLEFEVNEISKKLSDYFKADKINIASIGNIVSQLHIHIVVRNKKDLSWPETVWGKSNNHPYSENQLIKLKKEFQGMFAYL